MKFFKRTMKSLKNLHIGNPEKWVRTKHIMMAVFFLLYFGVIFHAAGWRINLIWFNIHELL